MAFSYRSWNYSAALLIYALVYTLTSCGHLETPRYRGIGSPDSAASDGAFRTPGDYLLADDRKGVYPIYMPRTEFHIAWPVANLKVNRGFRPADDPRHAGVDLGGVRGTAIRSAHEGVVIYAGNEFRGYGNLVIVEYSRRWATLYAHLDTMVARAGYVVREGDPLGTMGSTGDATGVHLHFELIKDKRPIDPMPLLNKGPTVNRGLAGVKGKTKR